MNYRRLEIGEVILATDEIDVGSKGNWAEVRAPGGKVGAYHHPIRRRIEDPEWYHAPFSDCDSDVPQVGSACWFVRGDQVSFCPKFSGIIQGWSAWRYADAGEIPAMPERPQTVEEAQCAKWIAANGFTAEREYNIFNIQAAYIAGFNGDPVT